MEYDWNSCNFTIDYYIVTCNSSTVKFSYSIKHINISTTYLQHIYNKSTTYLQHIFKINQSCIIPATNLALNPTIILWDNNSQDNLSMLALQSCMYFSIQSHTCYCYDVVMMQETGFVMKFTKKCDVGQHFSFCHVWVWRCVVPKTCDCFFILFYIFLWHLQISCKLSFY